MRIAATYDRVYRPDSTVGLTRDDEQLHDGRVRLWDEFNRAWLVSLQRQFDLAQRLGSGQTLEQGQSIMDVATLDRLSSELVRLCDSIEKHGLVDYQMGVAEEDIMESKYWPVHPRCFDCGRTTDPGHSTTSMPFAIERTQC